MHAVDHPLLLVEVVEQRGMEPLDQYDAIGDHVTAACRDERRAEVGLVDQVAGQDHHVEQASHVDGGDVTEHAAHPRIEMREHLGVVVDASHVEATTREGVRESSDPTAQVEDRAGERNLICHQIQGVVRRHRQVDGHG